MTNLSETPWIEIKYPGSKIKIKFRETGHFLLHTTAGRPKINKNESSQCNIWQFFD